MVRTAPRPISVALAFTLAAAFLVVTPNPARAHDSCVIPLPAATGALGSVLEAVNVFSAFLPNEAYCEDKFAGVEPKLERDFETELNALQTTDAGALAETYAECIDGMAADMFACDGVDLLSHVSLAELGTLRNNDIWGWTDPVTGKEYALVGATTGTAMVDVTDPRDPKVQGILPTASTVGGSSWRDIKVYQNYAFVVSEHSNHGMQVFDLTDLRDWDGTYTTYEVVTRYTGHGNAHNIFINEDTGFAYSVGAGPFSSFQFPNKVVVDPPSSAAGTYQASGAQFGHAPTTDGLTGAFALAQDGTGTNQACEPLVGFPAGSIAIADRGTCNFTVKAANAQAAGAIALVVVNNAPGSPITMGGDDPSIMIPAVMVSQADGNTIKAGLPATGAVAANEAPGPQCGTGLHMIDIRTPTNPTFAGCFQDHGYVHDTQCVVYDGPAADLRGREICFNSNPAGGNNVAAVDVTDKANPVALSRQSYPLSGYSHQGWLTEDQRFFLHGDELDETGHGIPTTTRVWNVENPRNPILHQVFQGYGTPSIDHNLYVEGRTVTASNYTSGLRVLDANDPAASGVTQVGFFDMYPENDNATFEGGTWSNYPYYNRPNVVAVNSIDRGLFMVDITSAKINALENDLDAIVAAGGIKANLENQVRRSLERADAALKLPDKQRPALNQLDQAIHLLRVQANIVDGPGKKQGDAGALRALADAIDDFAEDYR